MAIHVSAWWSFKDKPARERRVAYRDFGARALSSASTAGITAVAILIPASMLIIQLSLVTDATLPPESQDNVFRGAVWFLVSLSIGLTLVWLVPMRAQSLDVARDFMSGLLFGPQLIALAVGMGRLVAGLWFAVNN